MFQDNVIKLARPGEFCDALTEVLRQGARTLFAQVVEAEVASFLESHADKLTEDGHRRLVCHGHLPEREIATGIGHVGARQPRVRDRGAQGAKRIYFWPSILSPYAFNANRFQQIPVGRIIRIAVATAMRQDEICRIEWSDFDPNKKMLLIWDRKDPRRKSANNQRIPMLDVTGYDPRAIIEEQRSCAGNSSGRIFPYNGRSVGTAFRRQCRALKIDDLHFHDLGTKAQAASSKLAFPLNRSHS